MNKSDQHYYALRFRSSDQLHRKGDIKYETNDLLYVGQTDECGLRIVSHPDYEDCNYAVIVKSEDGSGWRIIRQESSADISVNGTPLALVTDLHHGDLLKFDQTVVQFTEEQGEPPTVSYIQHRTPWGMWAVLVTLLLLVAGILVFLHESNKEPTAVFKDELLSVCKVEADTLLVYSTHQDEPEVVCAGNTFVGTGFITDDGYFVTARHCVEFWLTMEDELRPDTHDIRSPIVLWAIKAEMDTTIRLVAKVRVASQNGKKTWFLRSDDFTMDKSRDDIYECGGFETPYLWRSVMSRFEKRDAEFGDVAVMRWHDKGTVHLGKPDSQPETGTKLFAFGFPQNEVKQSEEASFIDGTVLQKPLTAQDYFLCEKGFDAGFSGAPVFTRSQKSGNAVVGIVTRSDKQHTLIVPVSQIHRLISKIPEQ